MTEKDIKIQEDIVRPVKKSISLVWLWTLLLIISVGGYGYFIQLRDGLGVTAMRDYVSWGVYISNFVFFVAVSLVGMLISATMHLLNIKWITPISRIAEIIAIGAVATAGIAIIIDMGRPDRVINVLIHGRFQSPILWDVTVITTYLAISVLLFWLPMLPDLAMLKNHEDLPKWKRKLYTLLALNWIGSEEQKKVLHKAVKTLLIIVMPVALAIHTVTSWLFASTLRPGWDSTNFGPYFVTGAFVAGVAAVIIVMFIVRSNYGLKNYLTERHFDLMAKLLVLVALVYLYFNINEYLVPAYKMREHEGHHLTGLFVGNYALMFWFAQIAGLLLPIVLLTIKAMRRPLPVFVIAIFVLIAAWFKRYIIVVPTMEHPYLPIQNVPESFAHYFPTGLEMCVTAATISGAMLIITVLAKTFPIMSISELQEESK